MIAPSSSMAHPNRDQELLCARGGIGVAESVAKGTSVLGSGVFDHLSTATHRNA